ncbi:hypothetical protein BDF19DRAFT_464418 [Syncephalis fuscata]|nr:hypothetical protein BDF19DRAFT_464418 [Syncephalis fuscata]
MYLSAITALTALYAVSSVSGHGHLSYPPCRGCDKYNTARDSINSPLLTPNLCRGEPAGVVTTVNHQLTLQIDASAPHVGPCSVYLLDENLGNPIKVADKENYIPSDITGRKVLRWTWEGCHVQPCEKYEQCSDITISGGNGGYTQKPPVDTPVASVYTPATAPYTPPSSPAAKPKKGPATLGITLGQADKYDDSDDDSDVDSDGDYSSKQPSTPGSTYAQKSPNDASDAAGCSSGQYTCNGNKFGICNGKGYTWFGCSPGSICHQSKDSYYCGPPKQQPAYY